MWALILVGPALERLLGHLRFAAVYLLSALGGSVLFYLSPRRTRPRWAPPGPSSACSVRGSWCPGGCALDSRAIVFLIVLNLAISFVFRSSIAWQAHVGGLIVGSLLTAAYAYAPRHQRALIQAGRHHRDPGRPGHRGLMRIPRSPARSWADPDSGYARASGVAAGVSRRAANARVRGFAAAG